MYLRRHCLAKSQVARTHSQFFSVRPIPLPLQLFVQAGFSRSHDAPALNFGPAKGLSSYPSSVRIPEEKKTERNDTTLKRNGSYLERRPARYRTGTPLSIYAPAWRGSYLHLAAKKKGSQLHSLSDGDGELEAAEWLDQWIDGCLLISLLPCHHDERWRCPGGEQSGSSRSLTSDGPQLLERENASKIQTTRYPTTYAILQRHHSLR